MCMRAGKGKAVSGVTDKQQALRGLKPGVNWCVQSQVFLFRTFSQRF